MVARRALLKRAGAVAVVAGMSDFERVDPDGVLGAGPPESPRPVSRAMILLDRSGSMEKVRQATIDGLNTFLAHQRNETDLRLSLLQFDTADGWSGLDITETFVDVPSNLVKSLDRQDFVPRGGTPLRAAVSAGIRRMEEQSGPGDKKLMVIQTDGDDTTSPAEISLQVLKDLIKAKTDLGDWTFVFLGADIDAWGASESLGVAAGNTLQYSNTYDSTVKTYATASAAATAWNRSAEKSTLRFFTPKTGTDTTGFTINVTNDEP